MQFHSNGFDFFMYLEPLFLPNAVNHFVLFRIVIVWVSVVAMHYLVNTPASRVSLLLFRVWREHVTVLKTFSVLSETKRTVSNV